MKKIFTLFAAAAIAAGAQAQSFTFYHGDQPLEDNATYTVGYTEDELGFYNWDSGLKIGFNAVITTFIYEVTSTGNCETCPALPGGRPGSCFPVQANEPKVISMYNGVTFDEETPVSSLGLHCFMEMAPLSEPMEIKVRAFEEGWEDEAVNVTVTFDNFDQASIAVSKNDSRFVEVRDRQLSYSIEGAENLILCDALGHTVMTSRIQGTGSLSLASLPAGLYLYRAGNKTGKFIVR